MWLPRRPVPQGLAVMSLLLSCYITYHGCNRADYSVINKSSTVGSQISLNSKGFELLSFSTQLYPLSIGDTKWHKIRLVSLNVHLVQIHDIILYLVKKLFLLILLIFFI